MFRLFLLAILLGTAACSWILTQNTPEYATDAGSVPMSTVTDAVGGPVGKLPTAVPAIPMYITTDLRQCTHPVLDVGMAHRIGFNNRKPTCVQVWLFKAVNLTGPFKTLSPPLVWSGNVTIPKTLLAENAVPNGTSHTVYGTHRFDLVNMTRMLSGNNMYYVAISICLDRALHTPTATFNEVRWLFGLAPRVDSATDPPYEWIDRFGTYIPAHKELSNWTAAAGVEPWVAAPLHAVSVSQRLAARIYLQCTGPSNTSDTRILANGTFLPLWNTSMLLAVKASPSPPPSPLLLFSPTPSPSPPPLPVVLDSSSPSVSPVLSPVVEVSSSPPPVPIPIPSSMVVVATPTAPATPILVVTPTVTMTDWPSPGPMPTGISPVDIVSPVLSSSPPPPPTPAPNGTDKMSSVTWETIPRTWKIVLGVVGGFLLLATAGLCIYFYAGYRTRRMYEVVDDREMQHKAQREQSWFGSLYNKLWRKDETAGNGKHVEVEADDDRILPMDEMDPENTSKDVSHGSMDSGDEEQRENATRPYRDEQQPLETPQEVKDRVERERVERLRMVQVALDTHPASPSTKPKGKGKE